jgi:hypothetical protein
VGIRLGLMLRVITSMYGVDVIRRNLYSVSLSLAQSQSLSATTRSHGKTGLVLNGVAMQCRRNEAKVTSEQLNKRRPSS